jgi:phosphoglucomutase/phosphomannomutase
VRAIDDLLVGFKYIAQTMERQGPERFVFGAEESLGYLAGTYARDKDAAVAGLYLSELAAELQAEGKTLLDRLDALYVAHGYHVEDQRSHTCEGPRGKELFQQILAAFRDDPPRSLGGLAFRQARDYGRHEVRALPGNKPSGPLPEPQGDLIFFDAAAGEVEVSVAVRPSGTEPKIKFYFFARSRVASPAALAEVKSRTDASLQTAMQELDAWVRSRAAM